jgi:hypothetical protein
VQRVGKLPINEAAIWICGRPEVALYYRLWRIRLKKWLPEVAIEVGMLREPILAVRVYALKNGDCGPVVIPICPTHQVSNPFGVHRTELALDLAHHVAVPSFSEIDSFTQTVGGFVEQ